METFKRDLVQALRDEQKKQDNAEDSMNALKNAVSQISQSIYYNGFKR